MSWNPTRCLRVINDGDRRPLPGLTFAELVARREKVFSLDDDFTRHSASRDLVRLESRVNTTSLFELLAALVIVERATGDAD